MKTYFFKLLLLLFIIFSPFSIVNLYAQGCSDAGFCTMGAMKPAQSFQKEKLLRVRGIEISQYMGNTKFGLNVFAINFETNFSIGKKNNQIIQVKIPYYYVVGHLKSPQGISDLSLSYTRQVFQNDDWQINATLGAKIPTGNGNDQQSDDGKALPMYYQTSLGTYDAVFGVSAITKNWLFATGLQYPLFQNPNQNQFLWGVWKDTDKFSYFSNYPRANALMRMPDIMFRIERSFRFSKFSWHVGLLNIIHTAEDIFTAPNGSRIRATGSAGLVVNLLNTLEYKFSVSNGVRFVYGQKLRNNDISPSGLSREYVLSLSYFQQF